LQAINILNSCKQCKLVKIPRIPEEEVINKIGASLYFDAA
jgi:ribonuclease HI